MSDEFLSIKYQVSRALQFLIPGRRFRSINSMAISILDGVPTKSLNMTLKILVILIQLSASMSNRCNINTLYVHSERYHAPMKCFGYAVIIRCRFKTNVLGSRCYHQAFLVLMVIKYWCFCLMNIGKKTGLL